MIVIVIIWLGMVDTLRVSKRETYVLPPVINTPAYVLHLSLAVFVGRSKILFTVHHSVVWRQESDHYLQVDYICRGSTAVHTAGFIVDLDSLVL